MHFLSLCCVFANFSYEFFVFSNQQVFELPKPVTILFCRYFQGSEGYRKHVFNYWHGVLASYFEGVDDMDRKAEVRRLCGLLRT